LDTDIAVSGCAPPIAAVLAMEGGDVELSAVADLCDAFGELARLAPGIAAFTARRLARQLRAQARPRRGRWLG
jgi:hypothetical protein